MLLIHFLVVEPILLKLDFDLDFVFDQLGSLNIEEPLDFGFVVEAPKNELDRVSDCDSDFEADPNGHQEEDFDSCAKSGLDDIKTKTKLSVNVRCAFMASFPYSN